MRSPGLVIINLIIVFLLGTHNDVFSQPFIDELKSRLPRTDRYKLTKAMSFITQGDALISKTKELPISGAGSSKEKGPRDDAYYTNRIKASYCYRNANGLLYDVLDRSIKEFWKEFKGDNKALGSVVKIENEVYDSLIVADKLREKAENEYSVDDKIRVVSKAESMESKALLKLEKVLYTYINWPIQADLAWLLSKDLNVPNYQNRVSNIGSSADIVKPKSSNENRQLSISEKQPENFNEFSGKTMPGKKPLNNIDYAGLNDVVIDSVHKKWHKEADFVNLNAGASKKIDFGHNAFKNDNNTGNPSKGTIYKIQIAANRTRMSQLSLKSIYQGHEKIFETYEDNWYKYTVGKFKTLREASDFKKRLNINKAFIVVYLNGKRIK